MTDADKIRALAKFMGWHVEEDGHNIESKALGCEDCIRPCKGIANGHICLSYVFKPLTDRNHCAILYPHARATDIWGKVNRDIYFQLSRYIHPQMDAGVIVGMVLEEDPRIICDAILAALEAKGA